MAGMEIKSDKILIKNIFSDMWFAIPEYQRPYVWGDEEISNLLDDLTFAMTEKPDAEYFLGSFVFQEKPANPSRGQVFHENDLLDGQQRMTTILLLFAVLRDIAASTDAQNVCQASIYQQANRFKNIPERARITFDIRAETQNFVDGIVKNKNATADSAELERFSRRAPDSSIRNMAKAILHMREFFAKNPTIDPETLLHFLLNKVLLIYVATQDLDDAFRLFTILNNRGVALRNSDIIKSINLGALNVDDDKKRYAKLWEDAENELGDDFDRFLNHIRTILVKDKARLNLLQEYEDRIYEPKEKEKATGEKRKPLLAKGKETFLLLERYLKHQRQLFGSTNYDFTNDFNFDNLLKVMSTGLPSDDWKPPLFRYFDKFGATKLLRFLVALDNKFSSDWIVQETPTTRIEAMNAIIKAIDAASSPDDPNIQACLSVNLEDMRRVLSGKIYGRRYARYVLLKLDYLLQNHAMKMHFETLSVEHILPQNPIEDSQWTKDFSDEQRGEFTDMLGNLMLITCKKNAAQGRLDYVEKNKKYFERNIDTFPNSLRVHQQYREWTPAAFTANQQYALEKLLSYYEKS